MDSLRMPMHTSKFFHHAGRQDERSSTPSGSKISVAQARQLLNSSDLNLAKLLQDLLPRPGRINMAQEHSSHIGFVKQDAEVPMGQEEIAGAGMTPDLSSPLNLDTEHLAEIPLEQVKQAVSDAVDEALRKAQKAAVTNHTALTIEELKRVVDSETSSTVDALQASIQATRFKRKAWNATPPGFKSFFRSVEILDWCLFAVPVVVFLMQHYRTLQSPSSKSFHSVAALCWIGVAGLYNYVVFQRFGSTGGILWLNGYILELVFMIESVLVCHIILQAFRTPKWVNEKAVFMIVIFRIVYQMLFYMGFAQLVFSGQTLPYVLGLWLLYVAFQSAMDDDSSFDIMDTRVVNLARAMFGDRLSLTKDDNGALFVNKENKTRLSLVGLMVFCLICVDCLLYVDVALTKIEELQGNAFLCFSSAIAASLCMPELIFVARDMFRRCPGLKYGISAVLVYTGVQMLLSQVWWPPICMDLIIWVSLLTLSAVVPLLGWRPTALKRRGVDAGTQSCLMESQALDGHDARA
jgi:tellurite resistance protein TerC